MQGVQSGGHWLAHRRRPFRGTVFSGREGWGVGEPQTEIQLLDYSWDTRERKHLEKLSFSWTFSSLLHPPSTLLHPPSSSSLVYPPSSLLPPPSSAALKVNSFR